MRLLLPGSLARPVPSSRVQVDLTAQSSGIRSLAGSLGSCSSLPTIGWARRRRRLELRWVFRGQDGGAPGTERRNHAACEWGLRPRPWRWSAQQRLGQSEPCTIWYRGRCEWRGAGERLAGGPRLAAKRRVPGGDTWTPQEREEALGSRCRVAARRVGPTGSGSFAGGYAGRSRVLMALAPERWRGRAGCRKPGACVWG